MIPSQLKLVKPAKQVVNGFKQVKQEGSFLLYRVKTNFKNELVRFDFQNSSLRKLLIKSLILAQDERWRRA